MAKKIVYLRGLWSYPKAVEWIKKNLEETCGLPVELFDYHDILTENINNKTYLKRVLEKYGDIYSKDSDGIILIGHSHGGTLAAIMTKEFSPQKAVLTNPAYRPWGILRKIPKEVQSVLGNYGLGKGYHPHFIVKYDGEVKERLEYFKENFVFLRDTSRVLYTGTEALNDLKNLKQSLLLIQSGQDEFVSVTSSLKAHKSISLPEHAEGVEEPSKEIMFLPNAEHAVLEEEGEYPKIYQKISDFIKR